MGLYEYLWRHGEWDPDIENYVLASVLPNVQLHLALDASRVPRPNWQLTSETQDRLTDIVRVPDDDPTYGGWVRLALHEQHLYRLDDRDYLPPDRSAFRSAAVVRTDLNGTVPARAFPFASGDVGSWWYEVGSLESSQESRRPQLVQLASVTDWLGRNLVLVPPLGLRYRAQLRSSSCGAPLRWYDSTGQMAVVLRVWRVRGDRVDTEWHTTLGADLLMRPDLLETLLQVYGWPLKELHRVRLENLDGSAA